MRHVIPKAVMQEIEVAGAPWRVELGGRHYKLFVHNRLAGIIPLGAKAGKQSADRRAELNTRAQVRRIIKEVKK